MEWGVVVPERSGFVVDEKRKKDVYVCVCVRVVTTKGRRMAGRKRVSVAGGEWTMGWGQRQSMYVE